MYKSNAHPGTSGADLVVEDVYKKQKGPLMKVGDVYSPRVLKADVTEAAESLNSKGTPLEEALRKRKQLQKKDEADKLKEQVEKLREQQDLKSKLNNLLIQKQVIDNNGLGNINQVGRPLHPHDPTQIINSMPNIPSIPPSYLSPMIMMPSQRTYPPIAVADHELHIEEEALAAMLVVSTRWESNPRAKVLRRYMQGGMHFALSFQTADNRGVKNSDRPPVPSLATRIKKIPMGKYDLDNWIKFFEEWVEYTPPYQEKTDYCCTGASMRHTTEPENYTNGYETASRKCDIFELFKRTGCCGKEPALQNCVQCKKRFCISCSEKHRHHKTYYVHCPCPQLTTDKKTPPTVTLDLTTEFWKCPKCDKTVCAYCIDRYRGMTLVENIPMEWSDGQLIESLEMFTRSKLLRYERLAKTGQMYLLFKDQAIRLRTQCIKLTDNNSRITILLKPPRTGRELHTHDQIVMPLVVEIAKEIIDGGLNVPHLVASMLRQAQMVPADVRFACIKDANNSSSVMHSVHVFFVERRCHTMMIMNQCTYMGRLIPLLVNLMPVPVITEASVDDEYTFYTMLCREFYERNIFVSAPMRNNLPGRLSEIASVKNETLTSEAVDVPSLHDVRRDPPPPYAFSQLPPARKSGIHLPNHPEQLLFIRPPSVPESCVTEVKQEPTIEELGVKVDTSLVDTADAAWLENLQKHMGADSHILKLLTRQSDSKRKQDSIEGAERETKRRNPNEF